MLESVWQSRTRTISTLEPRHPTKLVTRFRQTVALAPISLRNYSGILRAKKHIGLRFRALQRRGQSWMTRPTDLIARQKRRRSTLAVSSSYLTYDAHNANLSKDRILKLLPMPILVDCRSRRRVPTMYARNQRRFVQIGSQVSRSRRRDYMFLSWTVCRRKRHR